ncbi:enoyl-CoA hydratase/enoyl-CoA hydratase [Ilumatobacter fluminis]|uniref:Enoyl-CoA hydratase/enoyl-CoA hydratase n=1 Tax=Ilumatobacter fluminis TaxID=467091 RepID=A0A4R7HXW6_9ACTN|nr:enoyl-CoA hydratase/isomerase family protein [Ilumatobacter fluminis]TDT15464.1 enoyl-CoA hydratase/enoyl-CoA hydratase [Ilumatobacter fluminis]
MDTPPLSTIELRHEPGAPVATLLLDRPDKLNALTPQLLNEVIAACDWLNGADDVRVVVMRGAGRAFCAGFDLGAFGEPLGPAAQRDQADLGRRATNALADVRPLTIAAIHGHCVGGGVVLTSACDLRLAGDDARFLIPEVDLGIPLAWGGIPRLVREIGPALTKELVLTCRPFDAVEARDIRFVNRVVPTDELVATADRMAAELAEKPWFSIRQTKQHVNAVMDEIAGLGRSTSEADVLISAMADPESVEFSRSYLRRRGGS